jgi:hypothetical protein
LLSNQLVIFVQDVGSKFLSSPHVLISGHVKQTISKISSKKTILILGVAKLKK